MTFTATVAAAAPGSGTPTGTVTFYDGSTALGTAGLNGGSASLTTSALAVGSNSITASYGGDANFTTSISTALTQTVNQDGSATVVIGVPYPSVIGQAVTFTATVTAAAPGSGTPTGTVTFYDGSTVLDTATLSGGSAAFATSALALGSHPITAVYGGDTNFTGSTSPVFTQVVNEYASTTAVSSSVSPSVYGQSVIFTATVSATVPGEGTPTGTVTFYDGSTALDTETLSGGSAMFTTSSLAVASHSITAVYGGDASFNGSTSTALSQVVNPDGSTTVVTSSVNPSVVTQTVTFTATVTAAAPGSGTPTGQVIFYDGTDRHRYREPQRRLGLLHHLGPGARRPFDHGPVYAGNADFTQSTSTPVTQTVNQDGSTTTVSFSANPAIYGEPVTFTATVSAAAPGSGTPTGTVTFYDGTTAIDTETLAGGMATFTTSSLALGNHSISAGYGGDTDFTTSTSATITVSITPVPPPAAGNQSVTVGEGLSRAITLSSSDPDGDPLAFAVTAPPTAGQLTGNGANVTYTPGSGFSGNDSFQFTVTDTTTGLTSVGVVSITVVPPPTASNQSVTATENSAQSITLTSTDPNADPLTYTVTSPPADGRLSGSGANLIYTPTSGYLGSDSFQFTATDAATGLVSLPELCTSLLTTTYPNSTFQSHQRIVQSFPPRQTDIPLLNFDYFSRSGRSPNCTAAGAGPGPRCFIDSATCSQLEFEIITDHHSPLELPAPAPHPHRSERLRIGGTGENLAAARHPDPGRAHHRPQPLRGGDDYGPGILPCPGVSLRHRLVDALLFY